MWPVAILCALFFGAGYVTKQELDASAVANLTTDNQRLRDQTGASVAGQAGMTLEEKRDLAAALGSIVGSVMVVYVPLEGETYAGDLRSAFAAAGWTAIATPSVLPPPPGARVAVSLEVVDDKQRDVVKCALTVARLPYAIQPWTNGTPSEFIWLPPLTP